MQTPDGKPSALGYALLIYLTVVVAAITLLPFEFRIPSRFSVSLNGSGPDVLANVALFLPLCTNGDVSKIMKYYHRLRTKSRFFKR